MKRLEEFLSKQYDLTLWTKVIYGSAVLAFEGVSGSDFEEAHLDEGVVMRVLGVLSDRLSPSTQNLYLSKYKRLARWLGDGDDEATPKLWRRIKRKKVDW